MRIAVAKLVFDEGAACTVDTGRRRVLGRRVSGASVVAAAWTPSDGAGVGAMLEEGHVVLFDAQLGPPVRLSRYPAGEPPWRPQDVELACPARGPMLASILFNGDESAWSIATTR